MEKNVIKRNRPTREEFRQKCRYMYSDLKSKILTNEWCWGRYLPSENEMAKIYSVSRLSVRKILDQLQQEGLIYRIPGKGTIVGKYPTGKEIENVSVNILVQENPHSAFTTEEGTIRGSVGILETPALRMNIMLDALESELLAQGINFRIMESRRISEEKDYSKLIEYLLKNNVCGHIVLYPFTQEMVEFSKQIASKGIGVIFLGTRENPLPGVATSVTHHNDYKIGEIAVRHLIDLGHKKIGCLACDEEIDWVENRIKGYQDTCESAGLDAHSWLVRTSRAPSGKSEFERWIQVGRKGGEELLKKGEVTGVFCVNDAVARGLFEAAFSLGVKIPQDLSVIGCDNDYRCFDLHLTTVKMECSQAAKVAANLMVNYLKGENTTIWPVDLKIVPKLIIKESTGLAPLSK